MTVPSERYRAVLITRRFLFDLLDRKKTPRVPRAIRVRAVLMLRHYPCGVDMERTAEKCPELWDKYADT